MKDFAKIKEYTLLIENYKTEVCKLESITEHGRYNEVQTKELTGEQLSKYKRIIKEYEKRKEMLIKE
jgi:hypothetical protein